MTLNHRLTRRTGIGLAASAIAALTVGRTLAQPATPAATAIPDLPQGPLGEQIQWFVDLMNGDPSAITAAEVGPHFSDNALLVMSAEDLATTFAELAAELAPISVEPGTMVTTRDMPPTTARFVVQGLGDERLRVSLGISSASGLIESLNFSLPPVSEATPVASPVAEIADLPEGPLGEQIAWLVELLNGDAGSITGDALEPRLADVILAEMPAADLAEVIAEIAFQIAPVQVEAGTLVTTRDMPPTSAQFVLAGKNNLRLLTTLSVDSESGLISGLFFQPAAEPGATPAA
jgi:hypothetical protein